MKETGKQLAHYRFSSSFNRFIFDENHQNIRWSNLIQLGDPKQLYDKVRNEAFEFIKNLDDDKESIFSQYMQNAIFKVPTPAVLQNTMDTIEEIFNNSQMVEDKDTKGDLYEYLLSKLSTSGKNGQFRTPKHIINMMVELMKPTVEDKIIDPACGTSGFLVSSIEYIKRNFKDILATSPEIYKYFSTSMIHGNDTDATMLGISAMNLLLHDMKTPKLKRIDSLSTDYSEENDYSLVLANPPFKGSVDESLLSNTLTRVVKTKKTELLFIALFLRLLKIGGRGAVIVPDGVLFGASNAHKNLRKELIENNQLEAVISMPSGVFKPYAGVSTGILIFTKTGNGGTDNVWFYDMTADGYSLDDKRNPVEENDIPDIIERFSNLENEKDRKRTDKSFFVSKQEIVDNDYDLSINKYKEIVYEKVEYEEAEVILQKLEEQGITLEKAMMIKKEDVDAFIPMLQHAIASVEREDEGVKEASLMGLLPCPVRIPLLEGFEKYLADNKDIKVKYELKAAYSGLGWIKDEVIDKNDIDKLADMFISAGFDLFFDKDLMGKFKEQGIFKDMTGIEKYNTDFDNENIHLKDPHGDYSMIGVVPAIFIVNKAALNGREVPRSWEDLLKPEFAKSVSLPIADFDLFNSILIHIYKLYGFEGVKSLGHSLLSNLHPAQMVEAKEPVVTIMPYFFSKMVPEKGPKEVIWPKEGAIISPIFMLTKASKAKELDKIIKFMSGKAVGDTLANQGLFPSVHPEVKNPVNGRPMLWVGWDFIYSNDMGELIKKCEETFKEGAGE